MTRAASPPRVTAWPGLQLGEPLAGGARNVVYRARRRSEDFVVRVSGRPAESVEWELDLLENLHAVGVHVPQTVPTTDGRPHDDGVLVQRFIPGDSPRTEQDWSRVVATMTVVHEATAGWPQRPGFASAQHLLRCGLGGDVNLDAMPAAAVELVRASWLPVLGGAECAIHGDLGAGNVLMTEHSVALVDWDEARVDVPAFDFAHLPFELTVSVSADRSSIVTAGIAWETATCWTAEPEYAARRLEELQARVR